MKHFFRRVIICIGFILCFFIGSAMAIDTGWLMAPEHPPVQARISLTGQKDVAAKRVEALLEVRLDSGWKTYWRSPGEGGIAPELLLDGADNISGVQWHWPLPARHEFLGVETLGYKDAVSFPLTLNIDEFEQPVTLAGTLRLASCSDICVLSDYPFWLSFNPSELQVDGETLHRYQLAMNQVPVSSDQVRVVQSYWDAAAQELQLLVENVSGWKTPQVLIDQPENPDAELEFSRPDLEVQQQQLLITSQVSSWIQEVQLSGENVHVTISEGVLGDSDASGLAVEISTRVGREPITRLPSSELTFGTVFLLALLGGLILNVMPCVLPVLGLKLGSIILTHGREKRQIRNQFLASSVGILCSFWSLALFILLLQWSGQALGWGIQFQNPWFIGFMVVVTGLFAVNMLGGFEVQLPSGLQTFAATRGGSNYLGHFLQGVFATLLATPCSAPFLGTAVGFAFAASPLVLVGIFTGLGIGMALPWILVALFPVLVIHLPKPGHWMQLLKQGFGLLLWATCLWLVSLLANFLPVYALALLFIPLVLAALWRLSQLALRGTLIGVVGILVIAVILQWGIPGKADGAVDELNWQPFDQQQIAGYVDDGKVVFIDITADWCITCKANKLGVLLREPVYSRLKQPDVILMRGDWTQPNPEITAYLQTFQRFGVPFNQVYGPEATNGVELPVILDSQMVIDTIQQAAKK